MLDVVSGISLLSPDNETLAEAMSADKSAPLSTPVLSVSIVEDGVKTVGCVYMSVDKAKRTASQLVSLIKIAEKSQKAYDQEFSVYVRKVLKSAGEKDGKGNVEDGGIGVPDGE